MKGGGTGAHVEEDATKEAASSPGWWPDAAGGGGGEPAGERSVTWEADAAGRPEDVRWR